VEKSSNSSSSSDSSSDSSSSSSDSSDSSDSTSESDSDSDSDDSSDGKKNMPTLSKPTSVLSTEEDSDDDFLVANDNDSPENVFSKASARAPDDKNFLGKRGDKTKGWATQKQRPGEWKKKRERR